MKLALPRFLGQDVYNSRGYSVTDWLRFYNHRRTHSKLGYLSPMNFEKKILGKLEKLAA